jgi:hypothetical protein
MVLLVQLVRQVLQEQLVLREIRVKKDFKVLRALRELEVSRVHLETREIKEISV